MRLLRFGKLGLALAAACAASAPLQADDFAVPPYEGAYQPQGEDERGLWMMADEDERLLRDSRWVITDEALNEYVRGVLCRTIGEDRCGSVRLYILRVPYFNASMAPNGTMRVYSGLLLRVRNEAELASVLGHEFAHFELRHTLWGFKRARTGSDLVAWTTLLGAMAASYGGATSSSGADIQTSVLGTIYRYKRDHERAADLLGFGYLANAGYRASAAADVWRGVMNESDRSAEIRGRRTNRYDSVAFFASHPTDLERADTLSYFANRVQGGEREGSDAYREAMAPWREEFLKDQLMLGDFGASDFLIERLAGEQWSPDLLYARAELYRGRGNPRDLVASADFYRDALKQDPDLANAYRGLGLALLRTGNRTAGSEAIKIYLDRVPNAEDAGMLRMMMEQ